MSESEMWMGSSIVLADGTPCSTQFHPALSCSSIGFTPPLRHKGLFRAPNKTLQAPTSLLCIITSGGKPVLVGGPPTIDLFQLLVKLGLKCLGKLWANSKIGKSFDDWFKKTPLGKIQQNVKCFLFGEPVDAATGRVFHENIDFELSGPIPLVWKRTYYSDAEVEGPLGHNWHHSYNISIKEEEGYVILRLPEGRETILPPLTEGETYYLRAEKITWGCDRNGYYYEDAEKLVYRFSQTKNKWGYRVLSKIMTKDGFEIQFTYNREGHLQQITDSRKTKLLVNTDMKGRVTGISLFENGEEVKLVRYKYDNAGNMVETLDANDVSKYFYYEGHLLVKLTNQSGMSFHWEYEGKSDNAKCVHTWGDDGIQEYWIEYGDGFTKNRNSLGDETVYFYDENNLIYKIIDARGGITHQTYNPDGELEIVTNPEGYFTKRKYDDRGNIIQYVNENDESFNYKYDDNNNLIYAKSPGGRVSSWKYDEKGRVTEKITPVGDKFKYGYEEALLKTITGANGREYRLLYNKQNDLEQVVFPNGLEKQWRFDCMGRVTEIKDVKGNRTFFEYDKINNVIKMSLPDGNIHEFSYDVSHNLTRAKDSLHEVAFTYGPMGILKSRTQNGRSVRFGYNKELQLRRIINEGDETYRFDLDGLGQVVKETGFDGMQREYIRDGAGRVSKVIRPEERWTQYTYDGTGNVVKEEHHDETWTAYRYNADGLLIEALNENGLIQFKRDKLGRIVEETQGEHSIQRKYDQHGECTQITSGLGADIRQQFDEEGNLIKLQAGESWQADWKRDETGLELYRQLTGGVSIHTDRDHFGRETGKSIGVRNIEQSRKKYLWGTGNRLQGIYDERTGKHTNFDYDAFDNLIKADYHESNKIETIYRAPDAIGNLYETQSRTDRKYDAGGRLKEDPNYNYYYDCEGNLIFKEFRKSQGYKAWGKEAIEKKFGIKMKATGTGWYYKWAASGMLMRVVNPEKGIINFGYDPLGRRIYKEAKQKRTCWLWDGNVPLHEWTETGEEPRIDIITWVFENGTFVPTARITDRGSESIVTDYLGTPTRMFDANGEKTWEAQLDIYGRVRTFAGRSLRECPFRYQGQYEDEETGLYYNRLRYYDPEAGNYISQDPIRLAGNNPTLYGYVKDPNSWIDVFGLDCGKVKVGDEIAPNSKVRRIKEGTNGKSIVIGRSMDSRVKPSAKNIGAEHWDGWDNSLPDEINLANNRKWIESKVAEGYTVIDIGLDPTYKTPNGNMSLKKGDFYRMETEVVFGTKR